MFAWVAFGVKQSFPGRGKGYAGHVIHSDYNGVLGLKYNSADKSAPHDNEFLLL